MTGTPLEPVRICASEELVDGGDGVRHQAVDKGGEGTVFFVRYDGKPFGSLNRRAHVARGLDCSEGKFFESSGLYLMCAAHGAIYEPDTGKCVGGPCRGARLRRVGGGKRATAQ